MDDFSLEINTGETLALVGESGSGKSVTCLSIMGLLPEAGVVESGSILFEGRDLNGMHPEDRRRLRGASMSMIFQEPMTSLNPVLKIGTQLAEAIRVHSGADRSASQARAAALLDLVRIPDARKRLRGYPHELSGGMRQRVMIAMALAGNPSLLIADEPTTALDVTVQAQILDLLDELQKEFGMAMLFVTHDLGVVAGIADRVCVMYAGQGVEYGTAAEVFDRPLMPYTAGLLRSVPSLAVGEGDARLATIPGNSPAPGEKPDGCAFGPRCAHAEPECLSGVIALDSFGSRHARCRRAGEMDFS